MFTSIVLRRISTIVLFAFTSLTLQPLQAAVQSDGSTAPAAPAPDKSQRYGQSLEKVRDALQVAKGKHDQGQNPDAEIAQVRAQKAELDALEADVEADFAAVGQHLRDHNLPSEILARHEAAVAEFHAKKNEFKQKFDAFEAAAAANDPDQRKLKLKDLAEYMQAQQHKKVNTPGDPSKLPFRNPKGNVRPPIESLAEYKATLFKQKPIHLAANGSISGITLPSTTLSPTPTEADLAETEDIQLSDAIKAQAQELNHNPVKIHNWVRNNIEYIPTYGSIQGADVTLQSKRGNAFDTASLEIALLRASGIPARYVYGTVQISAEQAMNWVGGVNLPETAQSLLGQGGIPNVGLASGGLIKFIKFEHVWVEAWVDYVPSRGAVNKTGDTWIPLDPSFKQYKKLPGILPNDLLNNINEEAAAYSQSATRSADGSSWSTGYKTELISSSLPTLQQKITSILESNPEKFTLEEVIGGREIIAIEPVILGGTLPYKVLTVGAAMTELPSNLRIAARVELLSVDSLGNETATLVNKLIPLTSLRNGSLNLSYIPATDQDSATWESYYQTGSKSFPAYLIKVKPRLSIDQTVLAESGSIGLGQDVVLKVSFTGASYNQDAIFNVVTGDEIEIGINGAGQAPMQGFGLINQTYLNSAAGNMYATAKVYWTQQDFQERLLAALHGAVVNRLPSVGVFATPLSVDYWFGVPRIGSYHSRQVDIKLSHMAAVSLDGDTKKTAAYVMHAGIVGSNTEGAVIEEVFSKPLGHGSNTIRLLQLANEQGIPIYHLTAANFAVNRTQLQHSNEVMIDIQNAINSGLEVIVPKSAQMNKGWSGSGYVMIDPITGSADYRISGGLSGNLDDEACQTSAKPVKAALPNISIIWWVLLGWMVDEDFNYNGAGVASAAKQIGTVMALVALAPYAPTVLPEAAALTSSTFRIFLVAFSGNALAEDAGDECDCSWEETDRRGGNSIYTQIHNACADRFTDFPARDIKMRGKHFDGLRLAESPPGTFYEIKTGLFYTTITNLSLAGRKLDKLLEVLLAKSLVDFYDQRQKSSACNYEFRFGVRDLNMMKDMQEWFIKASPDPSNALRVFPNGC